tara:strand:+ start:707 stop:901 length:195 start_codon:yes stop_codon:yes gene_type:complete
MDSTEFIAILVTVLILAASSEEEDQREREYYQNTPHDDESFGEFVVGTFLKAAIPFVIIYLLFG